PGWEVAASGSPHPAGERKLSRRGEFYDFPLHRLRFQQPDDLEAAERGLGHEEAAIVRQLIDGEKLERILRQQIDVIRNAAFHDFAILKRQSGPQVGMNGKGIEEAHVLLRGTAGEGVDEENRLGVFEAKSHGWAAVLWF